MILIVNLFLASLANAGSYELMKFVTPGIKDHKWPIDPKNMDVCRAYEKNLNSFKKLPHAMVCDRLVNPEMKDFSKPVWNEVDAWENRGKIKEARAYLWRSTVSAEEDRKILFEAIDRAIREDGVSLKETNMDLDNDGTLDHVYKYDYAACDPMNPSHFRGPFGRIIFVWDNSKNKLNIGFSQRLGSHWYDVFIYKGRVYLDSFGGNLGFEDGRLTVFGGEDIVTVRNPICHYRYKNNREGE